MCRTDPSEFVRRAAVHVISQWHCTGPVLTAGLATMCDAVTCDVDCDVKCAAVSFWRQYLPTVQQSIAASCCQMTVVAGSLACLLSTVSDCDRPVRLETLETLVGVRRLVENHPALLSRSEHCQRHSDRSCVHVCLDRDFVRAGLRRLPQSFELSADESGCHGKTTVVNCDDRLLSLVDDDVGFYSPSLLTRLRATLLNTDWESLLASESQTSDDCHAGNPASLLDDILKTAGRECRVSVENSCDDDNSQGSMIIDCY